MGSLESRLPLRKDFHSQRSSSNSNNTINGNAHEFWGQRYRSRFARLILFRKIDYLQLISAVAVFFFFIFLFQIFYLPSSERKSGKNGEGSIPELSFLKELDFGEGLKFEPSRMLAKFRKDANGSVSSREVSRFGYRKPKLALVFADLWVDPHQILMLTVATALRKIGYEIEVFALEDGPVHAVWTEVGLPLNVITADKIKIMRCASVQMS